MKKVLISLVLCFLCSICFIFGGCGSSKIEFDISFVVDNEVYAVVSTYGNEVIAMPNDPTKEGFSFDGWFWDENIWQKPFTANSLFDTPLVKDMKVYAKFTAIHQHSIEYIAYKASTCTETGNYDYWRCTTCGKSFLDENATTEINYVPIVLPLGHKCSDWTIVTPATCTENGLQQKSCLTCSDVLESETINATGHNISNWKVVTSATCTESGLQQKTCLTCSAILESETINATGHSFGNWTTTKNPTYYEKGEETRHCNICSHSETKEVNKLVANIIEPTNLIMDFGTLKWDGYSPFGFDVIINGIGQTIYANSYEPTLNIADYNSVKVASINVDGTKSSYVELNDFIVNQPINNLHFIDDGKNVTFSWDSPDDLYDYTFIYDGVEKTVNKTQHYYTVSRNLLEEGSEISVYVQGLMAANFYPSKKYTITLQQLDAPALSIEKLDVRWDEITHADNYKVEAITTETITDTSYSYDGADAGEYSIKVTSFGADYLNNFSTLTFTKLEKPSIYIEDNLVSWDAIAGQVRYATTINNVQTSFARNSYTIDPAEENDIYLYAMPVLKNIMQSNRLIISKFSYENYSTIYWGNIIKDAIDYTTVANSSIVYIPTELENCDFTTLNKDLTLIARKYSAGIDMRLIKHVIIPNGVTEIPYMAFSGCNKIERVEISSTVTDIRYYAFYACTSLTSIIIPNSVTNIGSGAFYCCSNLQTISVPFVGGSATVNKYFGYIFGASSYSYNLKSVPESLKEVIITGGGDIDAHAFYGCSNINKITIPSNVTTIGSSAFENCSALTSVYITDLVKWCEISFENSYSNPLSYAKNLYLNNQLIEDLVIPNQLTEIGAYSFVNACLKSVTFNQDFQCSTIGRSAFKDCLSLTRVNIADLTKWLTIEFEDINSNPLNCAKILYLNNNLVETLKIPSTVSHIGSYVFAGCESLKTVEVSSTVLTIGDSVFAGCCNLEELTIPFTGKSAENQGYFGDWFGEVETNFYRESYKGTNNLNSILEDDKYFYVFMGGEYYKKVASYKVNTGVSINGVPLYNQYHTYYYYGYAIPKSLKSVKMLGQEIVAEAFKNCVNLEEIAISSSITTIGSSAFLRCSGLTKVNITDLSKWLEIDFVDYNSNPLSYAKNLYLNNELVEDLVVPSEITKINNYAFNEANLKSVNFADNSVCEAIGDNAFANCLNLTTVALANSVKQIGLQVFTGCTSLTRINLSNSIEEISSFAFEYCSSLANITIPNSVTKIGEYAFYSCSNLASVEIGNSVKEICSYAFADCASLAEAVIPENVTNIGLFAFARCTGLQKIAIPFVGDGTATNTHFGYIFGAPSYSDNSNRVPESLKEVIINGGDNIADNAFYRCSNITNIVINSDISSIGYRAFCICSSLTEINIPSSVTSFGTSAFSSCDSLAKVYITDLAKWCEITFDRYYANPLYYAKNLYVNGKLIEDLIIPKETTKIGDYAFYACALKSVSFEENSQCATIGILAFGYCDSLVSIDFTNSVCETIGDDAFYNCTSLTKVNTSNLAKWCEIEFEYCYSNPLACAKNLYVNDEIIENLVIPKEVTKIGDYAFYNSSIKSLTFEEQSQCSTIGYYSFYNCTKLTRVETGSAIITIEEYAFIGCASLVSVDFTNSICESIGAGAFIDCASLTYILIPTSVINVGYNAFSGCSNLTIYLEATSVPSEWATNWNVTNCPVYLYSQLEPTTSGNYWHYDADGITRVIW